MESPVRISDPQLKTLTLNPNTPSPSPFPSLGRRRRSHLDSASYRTLVRIISHYEAFLASQPETTNPNPEPDASPAEKDSIFDRDGDGGNAGRAELEPLAPSTAASDGASDGNLAPVVESLCREADAAVSKQPHLDGAGVGTAATGEPAQNGGSEAAGNSVDCSGLIDVEGGVLLSVEELLDGESDEPLKDPCTKDLADDNSNLVVSQVEMQSSFEELLGGEVGGEEQTEQFHAAEDSVFETNAAEEIQVDDSMAAIDKMQEELFACLDVMGLGNDGEIEEGEIPDEVQDLEDLEEEKDEECAHEKSRILDATAEINCNNVLLRSNEDNCKDNRSDFLNPDNNEGNIHGICDDSYLNPQMKAASSNEINASVKCQGVATRAEELLEGNVAIEEGEDVEILAKKRRGPLTEKRKAAKKSAKKRKRAQKDREQGVKRLKLQPIVKPKVVKQCNFYMMGRCQQGDLCKFSHDATPLTKSQPCKYFACGTCLKGDDCPFDHQLSKYPCHNYTSKGMCMRGDKCKFSHEIKATEDSSTPTPGKFDSLLSSVKQRNSQIASTPPGSATSDATFSMNNKHLNQNSVKCLKEPVRVPKGLRFLSFGEGSSDSAVKKDKLMPEKCDRLNLLSQESQDKMLGEGKRRSLNSGGTVLCPDVKTSGNQGSRSVQSEISEASKILEEFLFCGGSF